MPIRFPQLPNISNLWELGEKVGQAFTALFDYLGRSNQQITIQVQEIGDRDQSNNLLTLGKTTGPTRIATDLTVPALVDNVWWVEVTGTSPSRVAAIKVRDGGVTRTIASVTF